MFAAVYFVFPPSAIRMFSLSSFKMAAETEGDKLLQNSDILMLITLWEKLAPTWSKRIL